MRKILTNIYKYKLFKRIVPSLLRRLPGRRNVSVNLKNFKICLNLNSSIDREIYLRNFYDIEKINYIENSIDLTKFDYFFDIGANIGFYTLYFASKYDNLDILSFEPINENFLQINKSIEINSFNNIKTFEYALSDREEEKIMWVTDLNKKGGFSVYEENDYRDEIALNNYKENNLHKVSVKSKIFDRNFIIKNKIIFIKIDVERHELNCLRGMTHFLKNSNNKIYIQIEIVNRYKSQVIGLLNSCKFNLLHTIEPENMSDNYGTDYYFSNFIDLK